MDLVTPGGSRWRVARPWRRTHSDSAPWAPELAGTTPSPTGDLGRRPIVVWRDSTVIHAEPAPHGREAVAERIEALAAAIRAAAFSDEQGRDHRPYQPEPGPGTTGGWGAPGQGAGGAPLGGGTP
ncbi:hypothetical protein [Mumia sp. DW29H23]|uniref:hypothetical protein n=1 Tax=Mumia sp. DW29H23 TaxID=3421241 RepID=UPI003D692D18